MDLSKLYEIQERAKQSQAVRFAEMINEKFSKVSFIRAMDDDPLYSAFDGSGDQKDLVIIYEALRFFAEHTMNLLNKTECFSKPASYEDLATYFLLSRRLTTDEFIAIPVGENSILLMFSVKRPNSISKYYSCYMKPHSMLTEENQEKFTVDQARDWYIYAITCLAFTNMKITTFVNIDDDEKLSAAMKRVKSGNFELPLKELAFLNYKEYPWNKPHVHFPIVNRVVAGENGYIRNTSTICNITPKVILPEVDLDGLEDKLYNLFAYQMYTQNLVGADTETTGLNVFFSKIVSLGLTFNLKLGYYLSFRHTKPNKQSLSLQSYSFIRWLAKEGCNGFFNIKHASKYLSFLDKENKKNLSIDTAKDICRKMKFMESIWHNAKYDYSMIKNDFQIDLPIYMDTMLAHYISRPGYGGDREKRGLKVIAPEELGIESWKIDVTKVQDDYKDIEAAYNARDCCYMFGIALSLGSELLKPSVNALFQIEMDYLPVLVGAELAGVRLDSVKLKQIEADLVSKRDGIEKKMRDLFCKAVDDHFDLLVSNIGVFGKPFVKTEAYKSYMAEQNEKNRNKLKTEMKSTFNLNSNPLMKFLFFKALGVIPPRKCTACGTRNFDGSDCCKNETCTNYGVPGTAPYEFVSKVTGEPSFDKHVKNILADKGNELMKDLNEYSAANKLISAYCTLDEKVNPLTGNIHPSYNQAKTATGRLSSSHPNFLRKLYTYCWKL